MSRYEPQGLEKKWQQKWEEAGLFAASNRSEKEKFFALIEFPYPSAAGLHVGHTRPYTALDVLARTRRMQGYNVLFPIGWDAFGLPAENFAIKNKVHPSVITRKNIDSFRVQSKSLGYSFDHGREVDTTDPDYYRWTQWIFTKLFEKGLAYKSEMPVNWCPSCKCVLANEEVIDGGCERCHSQVIRRNKSQWMLKITAYAQRLLDDLELVDYPTRVKQAQKNWIGRSEGAEIDFAVLPLDGVSLKVYTTRPDTLFGATYMVISPEHPMLAQYRDRIANYSEVQEYQVVSSKKSDFERSELVKDKTGVRLDGLTARNPVTGTEIPIFVSDYVLMTYGTGAIMAVPGHDERDWDFAQKFGLPIVEVVAGGDVTAAAYTDTDSGIMVNSGFLDGLEVSEAKVKIAEWIADQGLGVRKVNFKLRDWVFARQRYWGEPIPIVHCPHCSMVTLPDDQLPLILPMVESYEPTDTGESPLSAMMDWVNTTCPQCGGAAQRETDTMPQWAGSSWYFLRYCDPHNQKELASSDALNYWMNVDWYNGGMEHSTLHLLYSRFWHKFLFDLGVVSMPEPYKKRTSHGDILGPDGVRMSKTRGNVVDPLMVANENGADTMRLVILFVGDFEKTAIWSPKTIIGCRRFLERVWSLSEASVPGKELTPALESLMHKTIKKVTEDIEALKFNTAIAALMSLANEMSSTGSTWADMQVFLKLLSPFAPHICEEIWQRLGTGGYACTQGWPVYDPAKTLDNTVELAVQIAGKLRATLSLPRDTAEQEVIDAALALDRIAELAAGKTLKRAIVVPNKLVNLILV